MAAQTPRDPWRTMWQVATSDGALVVLLLGIAAGLTITAWLPQAPLAGRVAYARWLSETQARFGGATSAMRTLGLFAITRSFGFRAMLALLGGCLLLRLIESADRLRQGGGMTEPIGDWQKLADVHLPDVVDDLRLRHYRVLSESPLFQADRWPWADLFPLLAHGGALLLLIGLLIAHLWSWQAEELILQAGGLVTLSGSEKWVALSDDAREVTHSPGVVPFVEECGPGVQIEATNDAGRPLSLQQTAEAEPVTQLTVALTEDRYFAIPDEQMIVRLVPRSDDSRSPVEVQFYRSPPGRLIVEMVTEKGGSAQLTVDDVTLELTQAPYARVTATSNPGRWPTGAGLVLVIAGLLGGVMWPARRFWLRGEEEVEGAGDLPPMLAVAERKGA